MDQYDDYDGVQYDTFYAPSADQIEAATMRARAAEALAAEFGDDISEWTV